MLTNKIKNLISRHREYNTPLIKVGSKKYNLKELFFNIPRLKDMRYNAIDRVFTSVLTKRHYQLIIKMNSMNSEKRIIVKTNKPELFSLYNMHCGWFNYEDLVEINNVYQDKIDHNSGEDKEWQNYKTFDIASFNVEKDKYDTVIEIKIFWSEFNISDIDWLSSKPFFKHSVFGKIYIDSFANLRIGEYYLRRNSDLYKMIKINSGTVVREKVYGIKDNTLVSKIGKGLLTLINISELSKEELSQTYLMDNHDNKYYLDWLCNQYDMLSTLLRITKHDLVILGDNCSYMITSIDNKKTILIRYSEYKMNNNRQIISMESIDISRE
ncbi:MAG: hypothetical protein J6A59_14125 [Lachnospiraceae bacterium]|nr:hypothetical protein [Lachnospiraceae bacterium]